MAFWGYSLPAKKQRNQFSPFIQILIFHYKTCLTFMIVKKPQHIIDEASPYTCREAWKIVMKSSCEMCEIFYLFQPKDFMRISSVDNWNVNSVNFIWEKSGKVSFIQPLGLSCFWATNVLQFDYTCVNFLLSKNKSRYQLQKMSILTFICHPFWHRNVTEIFNTTALYIYIYLRTMMFEKINASG